MNSPSGETPTKYRVRRRGSTDRNASRAENHEVPEDSPSSPIQNSRLKKTRSLSPRRTGLTPVITPLVKGLRRLKKATRSVSPGTRRRAKEQGIEIEDDDDEEEIFPRCPLSTSGRSSRPSLEDVIDVRPLAPPSRMDLFDSGDDESHGSDPAAHRSIVSGSSSVGSASGSNPLRRAPRKGRKPTTKTATSPEKKTKNPRDDDHDNNDEDEYLVKSLPPPSCMHIIDPKGIDDSTSNHNFTRPNSISDQCVPSKPVARRSLSNTDDSKSTNNNDNNNNTATKRQLLPPSDDASSRRGNRKAGRSGHRRNSSEDMSTKRVPSQTQPQPQSQPQPQPRPPGRTSSTGNITPARRSQPASPAKTSSTPIARTSSAENILPARHSHTQSPARTSSSGDVSSSTTPRATKPARRQSRSKSSSQPTNDDASSKTMSTSSNNERNNSASPGKRRSSEEGEPPRPTRRGTKPMQRNEVFHEQQEQQQAPHAEIALKETHSVSPEKPSSMRRLKGGQHRQQQHQQQRAGEDPGPTPVRRNSRTTTPMHELDVSSRPTEPSSSRSDPSNASSLSLANKPDSFRKPSSAGVVSVSSKDKPESFKKSSGSEKKPDSFKQEKPVSNSSSSSGAEQQTPRHPPSELPHYLDRKALQNMKDIKDSIKQMRDQRNKHKVNFSSGKNDNSMFSPSPAGRGAAGVSASIVPSTSALPLNSLTSGPSSSSNPGMLASYSTLQSSNSSLNFNNSIGEITIDELEVGYLKQAHAAAVRETTEQKMEALQKQIRKTKKLVRRTCRDVWTERDAIVALQRRNWSLRKALIQNEPPEDSVTTLNFKIEKLLRQEREVDLEMDQIREEKQRVEEDRRRLAHLIEEYREMLGALQTHIVPLLPPEDYFYATAASDIATRETRSPRQPSTARDLQSCPTRAPHQVKRPSKSQEDGLLSDTIHSTEGEGGEEEASLSLSHLRILSPA